MKTDLIVRLDDQRLMEIQENSFKNFHCKGLHYLCIERDPQVTKKVYFFEGDVAALPEVVSPHNHRYNFNTVVRSGKMIDRRYAVGGDSAESFDLFNWRTPLNGGKGFEWESEIMLSVSETATLFPGSGTYPTEFSDIHTIQIIAPETVIEITQFHDEMPITHPSQTFIKGKQPPALNGLYEKFTMDEVIARLSQAREMGINA